MGEGGALVWAVPESPAEIDPLLASTHTDQLASRQVHEPLVESVAAPFGDPRRLPGLAASLAATRGGTVWRVRLRAGIRFQDGTPLNAAAVLRNAERWQVAAKGRALLGEFLADAPRPDLVRFILPAPNPRFDELLAASELGIVAPPALRRAAGADTVPAQATGTGTGPFELRERGRRRLLLARNTDWWGSDRGLGPALDQVELIVVDSAAERLRLVRDGRVQVAPLPARLLAIARRDPLLATSAIAGAGGLTSERSVRGLTSDDTFPPMLNDVWRTSVGAG